MARRWVRGIRCAGALWLLHMARSYVPPGAPPGAPGAPAPGRRSAAALGFLPLASQAEEVKSRAGDQRVTLKNGLQFPKASYGLQVYDDDKAERLTLQAIEAGYRNFFASALALNQKGFARAIRKSGVPRDDFFICGSVVSNLAQDFEDAYLTTKDGCAKNLEAFAEGGITELDMILLDYPAKDCETIRGQWKAFEEMLAAGQTKSLAVSNFSPQQLDCILANPDAVVPALNQLQYSLKNYDTKAVQENARRGVLVQAWAPLGSGSLGLAASSACEELGAKYGKSSAQIALRWILQTGATFTTQSQKKEHMVEDLNIFDFELTEEEVLQLSDISNSVGGRLSAAAEIVVPFAGTVGGAVLISSVLDSFDQEGKGEESDAVIRASKKKAEEAKKKKKQEEEEDEEDDGAL